MKPLVILPSLRGWQLNSVPSAVPQPRAHKEGQWDQLKFPVILRLFSSHRKGSHDSSRFIALHGAEKWRVGGILLLALSGIGGRGRGEWCSAQP